MNDLNFYVDKIKKETVIKTDSTLAVALGLQAGSFSQFKTGRAIPSDLVMLRLAELAKIPYEKALIDVSIWRNKKDPKIQKIWIEIGEKLTKS